MFTLFPSREVAEMFFVLPLEFLSIDTKEETYSVTIICRINTKT